MMQQRMPWDEDWSQSGAAPVGPAAYPSITMPRDPRQVAREDGADLRARNADARAAAAQELTIRNAERVAANDAARLDIERQRLALAAGKANGNKPGNEDLASVRAEALDKIKLARSLQQRSRDGWFTTGIGSSAAGWLRGTPAYDLAQDTETLKNAGALTRVMEMSRQNGGKNPLTPLSNSDFQALSNSLTNLDPGQSDQQYQANVQRTIDLYTRAYQGAGGTDLEGDLDPARRRRSSPATGGAAGGAAGTPGTGTDTAPTITGGGGPTATLATGGYKDVADPARAGLNARINAMLRRGASDAEIRATISGSGANADMGSVAQALDFRRKHPGYRGDYSVDLETRSVPTTDWNRFAASPLGTAAYATVDAGLGGTTDEFASLAGGGDLADLNARKQAAFAANPKSAFAGQVLGTIGAMASLGAVGRSAGVASRFGNPGLVGDLAFSAASGAGQSNDNRVAGAVLGTVGAAGGNAVGNLAGRGVGRFARTAAGRAVTNSGRRMFGRMELPHAVPLSSADATVLGAVNRAGPDNVTSALTEARTLGVPFSLADTDPHLRELAGAAVRRSPAASTVAENSLLPRARGQYDRLVSSVEANLGPTTNIPQRSADLTTQARSASSALYGRAYGNPVPGTPELDAVLGTPFGRQALSRARTIAANERRDPAELGFSLDANGAVVLNPQPNQAIARHLDARAALDEAQDAYRTARQTPGANADAARDRLLAARDTERLARAALSAAPDPSAAASVPAYTTQTLDYVKRGMDDVLEEQRNPITGRLSLDEAGRAQNAVRGQLLSEVDRLNPDFGAARAAYAGPVASRDALTRGTDAYGLHPDELGIQVGAQSPEHLGQMQLGYRGAMVDHAGRVRDNSNPWTATLGAPLARQRLATMYPQSAGVPTLLRQAELENGMAQTTNAILGNSRTARNQIADQAFETNPILESALHAGAAVASSGASLPGTAARLAGSRIAGKLSLGLQKRAADRMEAEAASMAPTLLDTDPATGLKRLTDLLARDRAWQDYVSRSTPQLGMFGRRAGVALGMLPLSQ